MKYEELLKECKDLEMKIFDAMLEKATEPQSREDKMVDKYGETCQQKTAAKILSVSQTTISNMIKTKRLRTVDSHVDVRSIAEYIQGKNNKPKNDIPWFEASKKSKKGAPKQ